MKGEFSRLTFDRRRHYSGVLWQQGRVGVDSDWNEWVEQMLYRLKTETDDVIGFCGRPLHDPGFGVSVTGSGTASPSIQLSPGRLYAGGLLAELDLTTDFFHQIDWPIPTSSAWANILAVNPLNPACPGFNFSALQAGGTRVDLIYAEVWQRHLTALNDEAERAQALANGLVPLDYNKIPEVGDYIRERALGGPDTCTRLQTVAQIKVWDTTGSGATDCASACVAVERARPTGTTGTLQVFLVPTTPPQTPCDEPLIGGYGGAENRPYRCEIHDPGPAGTATFKWSNENGALTVPVTATALTTINANTDIIVQSIGNDQITQLAQGDWVEMCGEETELGIFRNGLFQLVADPVAQTNGTWKIQLTGAVFVPSAPFLRRWSGTTQTVILNTQLNLDPGSGLSVSFFDDNGGNAGATYFHELDYWVWAGRTLTRDIEPPCLAQTPQRVRGIERSYCCLALVTWTASNAAPITVTGVASICPNLFPPLTELEPSGCCCCTVTVGDGKISQGEFTNLPDAFAALPPAGGIVCIEPGTYTLEKRIVIDKDNVVVRGCGADKVLITGPNADSVFVINGRKQIVITGLGLGSTNQPAIKAANCTNLKILQNDIELSRPGSLPAVSVQGHNLEIAQNKIIGGALEVRVVSQEVYVRENFIAGGKTLGIALGALTGPISGSIEQVEITGNTIVNQGSCGIGSTELVAPAAGVVVSLRNLRIVDNVIQHCCTASTAAIQGAVFLADVEYLEMNGNRIEGNGGQIPVTGIYIILAAGIRLHGNRVMNNIGSEAGPGAAAGIAIILVLTPAAVGSKSPLGAWPAASICGNLVESQRAPALEILGLGPMTLLDNRLVCSELPEAKGAIGATVTILNLGLTQGYTPLTAPTATPAQVILESEINILLAYLAAIGGEVIFSRNQCLLATTRPTAPAISSLFILTLDDLSVDANQSRCEKIEALNKNTFVDCDGLFLAATLRVMGNRFNEPITKPPPLSCLGIGYLATAIGNQGTHPFLFFGLSQSAFASNLNGF